MARGAGAGDNGSLDAVGHDNYAERMNRVSGFVSLHPYFKVPPDKLQMLKDVLPEFVAKTRAETQNLFYEFTINGDEVFCREGYLNAEALLEHLGNVKAMLEAALKLAELIRIEAHGPAAELEKLKGPLAHLNPAWFVLHRC
jgi:quinol monooxygenase YgiN